MLKLFIVQILVFFNLLFLCNLILRLFQKLLSKSKYKLSQKFSFVFTCILMLALSITVGKIVVIGLV